MRIQLSDTAAILVDLQERLFPVIHENEALKAKTSTLLQGLKLLEVPTIISEQYKKGLGNTVKEIDDICDFVDESQRFEKISFSCCDEPKMHTHLLNMDKKWVILMGIETHICVMQTAIDLLEHGMKPIVVVDAVSSRSLHDKEVALRRIEQEGGILTTTESILFELCRFAGNNTFKAISKLVK